MAKKSAIQKNINRKKLVEKNATKRMKLKKICRNKIFQCHNMFLRFKNKFLAFNSVFGVQEHCSDVQHCFGMSNKTLFACSIDTPNHFF